MLRYYSFITAFILSSTLSLKAQDKLPDYQSEKFRSLDVVIGITYPGFSPIPITVVYQQNIKSGFSWIVFSQVIAKFNDDKVLNERYTFFNWVEGAGIGRTLGNKWLNTGLYFVAGGRFYHTKLTADNASLYKQPTLVTNKINPELGLLYNIKVGRKKLYFTSQIYLTMFPFKNFAANPHSFSMGVGYRFKGNG